MQCLSVVDAMERYTSPEWGFNNITRPFSIIYYSLGGSAFYTFDGMERRFKKGNLYIMPANRTFSLREHENDKFYALYIHAYTFPEINEIIEIDVSLDEYIGDILKLLRKYTKKEQHKPLASRGGTRVLKLTDILISYVSETKMENILSLNDHIKKYVEENYVEVFKENNLSRNFNYSNEYIAKLFKREYNMTPKQYAKQLILRDITRLLENKVSVLAIANQLGFSSPENLCRFFKSAYGCPPSEYGRSSGRNNFEP